MAELARIGIALSEDSLKEFDKLIERRGYTNRSEAVRDLVRNELVNENSGGSDAEVFGPIPLSTIITAECWEKSSRTCSTSTMLRLCRASTCTSITIIA